MKIELVTRSMVETMVSNQTADWRRHTAKELHRLSIEIDRLTQENKALLSEIEKIYTNGYNKKA